MAGTAAPLDPTLALAPHQRHSTELQRKATVLAVFVPLAAAVNILEPLTRVHLGATTVWHWVQAAGGRA